MDYTAVEYSVIGLKKKKKKKKKKWAIGKANVSAVGLGDGLRPIEEEAGKQGAIQPGQAPAHGPEEEAKVEAARDPELEN